MGKPAKIMTAVLILVGLGYFTYYRLAAWHREVLNEATQGEKESWVNKTSELEEEVTRLQKEIKRYTISLPEEKLVEIFGEKPILDPEESGHLNCEELRQQILAFFSYLDKKKYVEPYNWKGGIHGWCQRSVSKFSQKRPIISGETRDIYGLTKNMAHLYRISGKKEIEFVKEILDKESDIVESIFSLFYDWFSCGDNCDDNLEIRPSNKAMYEYAGFFLNTLAGRSYLLRRESKIQTLISYYSVLIIHRANKRQENQYGIDIRPYIDTILNKTSNQMGLAYREHYLKILKELKEKYVTYQLVL